MSFCGPVIIHWLLLLLFLFMHNKLSMTPNVHAGSIPLITPSMRKYLHRVADTWTDFSVWTRMAMMRVSHSFMSFIEPTHPFQSWLHSPVHNAHKCVAKDHKYFSSNCLLEFMSFCAYICARSALISSHCRKMPFCGRFSIENRDLWLDAYNESTRQFPTYLIQAACGSAWSKILKDFNSVKVSKSRNLLHFHWQFMQASDRTNTKICNQWILFLNATATAAVVVACACSKSAFVIEIGFFSTNKFSDCVHVTVWCIVDVLRMRMSTGHVGNGLIAEHYTTIKTN